MSRFWMILAVVLAIGTASRAADDYVLGPDSMQQEGVPAGKIEGPIEFRSKVFANTVRNYWIYVPAQYDGSTMASVAVFQDGSSYVNRAGGEFRVPNVFDNLIHKKEMPVTIGIFINPGDIADGPANNRRNRSFEYDTLSDQYSKFIIDEMLPEVSKKYKLTTDPDGRMICGGSSGGICAFTVGWERPNEFRKIVSFIGSFTSIAYRPAADGKPMQPGGDLYPALIRKTPVRPLRIFLQDGSGDLNNNHGNWFLGNQQMLSSLQWANSNADQRNDTGPRYQINHAWGDGGHNGKHGGSIFPEIMRWTWKGYEAKPK